MENESTDTEQKEQTHETNGSHETSQLVPKEGMSVKVLIGVVVVVIAGAGVAYYFNQNASSSILLTETPSASTEISPDTVRAVVDGEEIIQSTLNDKLAGATQVLSSQGVDMSDPIVRAQVEDQILEDTINYILLKQAAASAGITSDPDALEENYQTFVAQSGGEEQLATQLEQASLTVEEFKTRLSEQQMIDTFITNNIDATGIAVSDEEIQTAYDSAVASAGAENVPPLTEVSAQIVQQLTDQKRQELVLEVATTLKETASIERK